jgi:hypothetical protein
MKDSCVTIALLGSLLSACGGFSDDPGKPSVLATVKGEISNPNSVEAPNSLRVALVWTGIQYNVAQELEVVPQFPARFSLQIDQLPAENALVDSEDEELIPPGMRVAFGTVVGYVDENQNTRLDMVEVGAEHYVDQLVATNREIAIVYVEATDAALAEFEQATGLRPPRGFGFIRRGPDVQSTTFPPLSEDFELFLDSDPMLNELMCGSNIGKGSGAGGSGVSYPEGRPAVYPSPSDPNLNCQAGGASYQIGTCEVRSQGACRGSVTFCRYVEWQRPDPVPPDWPCQGP